jgi:hypothetical protein
MSAPVEAGRVMGIPDQNSAVQETWPAEVHPTERASGRGSASTEGCLVVNADDWGRNQETTQRTLDCLRRKTVSSVSAMVFMADSERAAAVARESLVDAGLHLNFTAPLSAAGVPQRLVEHHGKIASYLLGHRLARVVLHPGLTNSFEYVAHTQLEEFHRLYGHAPERIDGHHHMHLCANVLFHHLLPSGTIARRNFSFQPGEKSFWNRYYRRLVDLRLAKRHRLVDFLFSLVPFEPSDRLRRIASVARRHAVELETHPVNPDEYEFLMQGQFLLAVADVAVAPHFALSGA